MKRLFALLLALVTAFSMVACSSPSVAPSSVTASGAPAATTAPAATAAPSTSTAPAAKAPSGSLVVYSPHDADPLNDGVNMFMQKYPGIQVEVVAAGTGELCNRIKAESASPIADVLWGGGADSLAAFKDYFQPYVCAKRRLYRRSLQG